MASNVAHGYRLVTALHTGGYSEVWRAEDACRHPVAIKFKRGGADDASITGELEGLRLVRGLPHPHLLQIRSYGVCDEELYLVTELADGSLGDRGRPPRDTKRVLSAYELVSYLRGAAAGLDHLHTNGLVHASVRPEHILVFNEKAKLASFSHTHRVGGPLPQALRTARPSAATPPEFEKGRSFIESDQYALAYTYACLRLGEHGFAVAFGQPLPSLAGVPEEKALRKALAREPSRRFNTCVECVAALESAVLDPQR